MRYKKGVAIMLIAAVCACVGQLFWKLYATEGFWCLVLGFGFYGLGALLMLYAYRFGPVSVLQPMLAANYVLSLFLGALVLEETIGLAQALGVVVVTIGVILIAGGEQ